MTKLSESQLTAYTLGGRIQRARVERGLSLPEFARAVGVSKVSAWSWENDKTRPQDGKLQRIADTLHISIDALIRSHRATRSDINEVVAACKKCIADAVGLTPDDVVITISFGRVPELRPKNDSSDTIVIGSR